MKAATSIFLGSLALVVAISPSALAQKVPGDRSAAMSQLVKETTVSARSSASLDQITAVSANARGAVEQIDPSARMVSEPKPGSTEEEGKSLVAGALPGVGAGKLCALSPDQITIVQSLRMQGQVVADECELIEWLAVNDGGRGAAEAQRRQEESMAMMMPELLTSEPVSEAQHEKVERDSLSQSVGDLIVLPGETIDLSANQ